jgi:predicted RNA-binding Zn-ribbon protein involved in translation (DUF1610 family)
VLIASANHFGSCIATVRAWYHGRMIDFPRAELLDDRVCLIWLERHRHADGFKCPRCGCTERRLFRAQGHFPAYHCQACEGYDTLLTGTVFAKTRQRPATLVLLLRGSLRASRRPAWPASWDCRARRSLPCGSAASPLGTRRPPPP